MGDGHRDSIGCFFDGTRDFNGEGILGKGIYTISGGIYTVVVGVGYYTVEFGNGTQ